MLHSPLCRHRLFGLCKQSEPNQAFSVNFSAGLFSLAIPWHDSPDGCRSSYINPRERLEPSPELAALQPSMKSIPACLTASVTMGETPMVETLCSGPSGMPAAAAEGAPALPTKASPGLLSCIKHRAHHPSAIPALLDNQLRGKQPPLQCLKSSQVCYVLFRLRLQGWRRRRRKRSSSECHLGWATACSALLCVIKSLHHPCLLFTSA